MADHYHEVSADVIADGIGAQPVNSRRWLKAGLALSAGFCFVVLSMMAIRASTPILNSSAPESTNLIGMSHSFQIMKPKGLRSLPLSAVKASINSSPLAKLAIGAIQANQLGRDVSMRAENMDAETKDTVAKMEEAVKIKVQDMAGITSFPGFFDPLGFSADLDEGKLLFYREAELKHGRVAMLASLGFLVGEQFHPLFGGNINVPSYIAFQETPLQTFWPAVLLAIFVPEAQSIKGFKWPFAGADKGFAIDKGWEIRADRVPGDFGFDPLGLKPTDPTEFKTMQTKELNNGRLAMIAAAGMVAQELVSGDKIF